MTRTDTPFPHTTLCRSRRRGYRGSAAPASAPVRGDRRPADGRDERRRRPVRIGQDVPAAGGEIGAGDEEGGGASAALHRGGEGARRDRKSTRLNSSH